MDCGWFEYKILSTCDNQNAVEIGYSHVCINCFILYNAKRTKTDLVFLIFFNVIVLPIPFLKHTYIYGLQLKKPFKVSTDARMNTHCRMKNTCHLLCNQKFK